MKTKLFVLGLGLLLVLGLAACNNDDGTGLGVVSVYGSASAATSPQPAVTRAAPVAGVSALLVSFDNLTLYNTAGEAVTVNVSGEVDLMSGTDNLIGTFEIPAGDYSGLSVPRLQLNVPFLTVTDAGTAEVEIDLPVIGGTCAVDGGTGSLQISLGGASVRVR